MRFESWPVAAAAELRFRGLSWDAIFRGCDLGADVSEFQDSRGEWRVHVGMSSLSSEA